MPNKPEINCESLRWPLTKPAEVKLAMLKSHLDVCRLLVNEVHEEAVTGVDRSPASQNHAGAASERD